MACQCRASETSPGAKIPTDSVWLKKNLLTLVMHPIPEKSFQTKDERRLNASFSGKRKCGYRAKGSHFGWMFNWSCRHVLFLDGGAIHESDDESWQKHWVVDRIQAPKYHSQVWRCLWPIGLFERQPHSLVDGDSFFLQQIFFGGSYMGIDECNICYVTYRMQT